jgi:hypothetical protein
LAVGACLLPRGATMLRVVASHWFGLRVERLRSLYAPAFGLAVGVTFCGLA